MIKVDEELKSLIPPLTDNEFSQLEKNIISEGCREPLILWNDVLIDGHNRYEICKKHNIEFKTVSKEFKDKNQVKIWMIDNQKGRRNLSDGWRFELAQTKKQLLLEVGKEKKIKSGEMYGEGHLKEEVLSIIDKTSEEKHNTREIIADDLGWSIGKVAMADKVWKESEGKPEIKQQVLSGEKSINQAYQEITKAEKIEKHKENIQTQKKQIEEENIAMPSGLFDVIVMDPPWNYGREYDPDSSRVSNPYPEMTQEELLKIEIPAKDNCILFLWTTHAFIFDAKQLIDKWGFTYKANLVWDKEKMGMGRWLRMQCEFCLVAVKGKPFWNNTKYRDIIYESRREHSRKPDSFFDMVSEITTGRKLEYFSRTVRDGWEFLGNDRKFS